MKIIREVGHQKRGVFPVIALNLLVEVSSNQMFIKCLLNSSPSKLRLQPRGL